MDSSWQITILSLAYIGFLFVVAWHGDRNLNSFGGESASRWIYPLSIGVYATSWTYYGAVGSAANNGWEYITIYLGPILVFIFGWPMISKFAAVARLHNVRSLADFMSARYGRTHSLAVLTTFVALLGTIPYIALQLKAVGDTFDIMAGMATNQGPKIIDATLFAAGILTVFAILFCTKLPGQRRTHYRGVMIAIAIESIVKLIAFVLVGLFCTFQLFGGFEDLIDKAFKDPSHSPIFSTNISQWSIATQLLLASLAIICLPRQFHVTFVEAPESFDRHPARWIFPIYLLCFVIFVIPIAAAGLLKFGTQASADTFVLLLPMAFDNEPLGAMAFLGGLSAATGMIIVSTMTLSIMLAQEIILPLIFRSQYAELKDRHDLYSITLWIRRFCIISIMFLAWLYYQLATSERSLAAIGLIAFVAATQFAPALIGGLYWRRGNRQGAFVGMSLGLSMWFLLLVLPELFPNHESILRPHFMESEPLMFTVLISLGLNTITYILVSLLSNSRLVDRVQAASFVDMAPWSSTTPRYQDSDFRIDDLTKLASRFIGDNRAKNFVQSFCENQGFEELNQKDQAPEKLVSAIETILAQEIGYTSARLVIRSVSISQRIHMGELVSLVDEASALARQNQNLLRQAIEHLPQGVAVIDQNQNLVAWNKRYQELFDYPENLLTIGRPIADLLVHNLKHGIVEGYNSDEEIQIALERRLNHLNKGNPYRRESRLSSGTTIEIVGEPMPNGGYVTSYSDISPHKDAERVIRESEKALRLYTDNIPAMIAYVDSSYRVRFINKAFEQIIRVWRDQVIGRRVDEIFVGDDYETRRPYLERAMRGRRQRFDVTVVRGDKTIDYEALYVPHRDESGTVQGLFVLYQDVSERNAAKLELERANETLEARVEERTEELLVANEALASENQRRADTERALTKAIEDIDQANRSKTRFLAAASHDLLQPLNAARLFASTLKERVENDETKDLASHLDGALTSAENLISTLLEISKLDAGVLKAEAYTFSLSELFNQLAQEFQVLAERRKINFRDRPRDIYVNTDPNLLRRVLQNFLSNALRYTEEGGRILFATRTFGNNVRLEIWDTGIGIHPDDLPSIFDEFHRLSEGIKTEVKGLGLGLSISRRICDLLGLQLKVHSKPKVGSCFSVMLPMADPENAPKSLKDDDNSTVTELNKPLVGRSVLVVDNDSTILTGMTTLLGTWGAKVYTGQNQADAISLIEHYPEIEVALIDYHLDHNFLGVDLIRILKPLRKNLITILITADRTKKMRDQAASVKAHVLHKPLKPASLRSLLSLKLRGRPLQPSALILRSDTFQE